MKSHQRTTVVVAVLSAALGACISCKSTPPAKVNTTESVAVQPGVPGGVATETTTLVATVSEVSKSKREVTLVGVDGKKNSVKCGPEVVNFDQIHAGDRLMVTVTKEVAVYMAGAHTGDAAAVVVAGAPEGNMPAGLVAGTVQVIGTVTAINLKDRTATLRFSDGSTKTVAVRKDVDLTKRQVGEQVVIRMTQAVALSVTKP